MNASSLLRDVRRAIDWSHIPDDQVIPVAIATVLREMALDGGAECPESGASMGFCRDDLNALATEMARERLPLMASQEVQP